MYNCFSFDQKSSKHVVSKELWQNQLKMNQKFVKYCLNTHLIVPKKNTRNLKFFKLQI